MSGKELLVLGEKSLFESGVEDYKLDAWYLLEYVMHFSRAEFYLRQSEKVSEDKIAEYQNLINNRSKHVPIQHLIGVQEFMGIQFEVNKDVLIPRQDTECLVEEVLSHCSGVSVLDVCTGSGCIGISIDMLGDASQVDGIDISTSALNVAKRNAIRLHSGVRFWKSDMFENVSGKYGIIVSNPPYIPSEVINTLMPEVRLHEPVTALDGGKDGIMFYRCIAKESPNYLEKGGMVFLEIGCEQGETVKELLFENGFIDIKIKQDLAGKDRIVTGMLE